MVINGSLLYVELHSFGITEDGWGNNDFGQLGLGDCGHQNRPQLFKCPNDSEWKDIFCGGNHTIGISVDGVLIT